MKIRYILIIVAFISVSVYLLDRALTVSDFQHCKATTRFTAQECADLTGYELKSK